MTQEQQDALERLRARVPEILEVFESGKYPRHLMDATLLDSTICGVPDEQADDLRDQLVKLPMVPAMRDRAAEILDELVRAAARAAGC